MCYFTLIAKLILISLNIIYYEKDHSRAYLLFLEGIRNNSFWGIQRKEPNSTNGEFNTECLIRQCSLHDPYLFAIIPIAVIANLAMSSTCFLFFIVNRLARLTNLTRREGRAADYCLLYTSRIYKQSNCHSRVVTR